MIRQLLIAAAFAATAATAYAAVAPDYESVLSPDRNVTVIEKNQVFPVLGPIVVEECTTEDCSDVQV
jgi:hypothetical protein